jgi:hypothetical protein
MSDCKHEKRSDYVLNHPRYVSYCQHCDADFTKFELDTLERAERAETRVKELEASLRRVREKSTMALSSLSTASKTLREIEGVGK